MRRVLHIVPSLQVGGAEKTVANLAINSKNYKAIILCLFGSSSSIIENDLFLNGCEVHYLNKKPGFDISLFYKVYRIVRKINPSIINTHLGVDKYLLLVLLMLREINFVHTLHTIPAREAKGLDRIFMTLAYHIWGVVPVCLTKLQKGNCSSIHNISCDRIRTIHNGIELNRFKTLNVQREGKRYIQVGRLAREKNHVLTLLAFSKVLRLRPNDELWIVGDGPCMLDLKELSERLQISNNVFFKGISSDVPLLLSQCDVFLMPSQYEGMPLALFEAFASGLPAIVSDISVMRELVEKIAILIDPLDIDNFANEMISLMNDDSRRKELSERVIEYVKQFTVDEMVKNYEKLYDEINNF